MESLIQKINFSGSKGLKLQLDSTKGTIQQRKTVNNASKDSIWEMDNSPKVFPEALNDSIQSYGQLSKLKPNSTKESME